MTGDPHTTVNTFQAIVRSPAPKTPVSISTEEYGIIQELRRLLNEGKHHQMMIGFRDGKYYVYHVNLHTTLTHVK
jgi:hypothetical protein